MTDSTNPRVMADNIRKLSNTQAAQGAELESKIEALQTYDEEEIETGETWINGRPIYRTVISAKAPNTTDGTFSAREVEFTNGTPIDFSGVCITSLSVTPFGYAVNTGYEIKISFSIASQKILIYSNGSSFNNGDCYIIIKYVKEPTPDVSPDPDSRSLEVEPEPEREVEEPINEELKKEEK